MVGLSAAIGLVVVLVLMHFLGQEAPAPAKKAAKKAAKKSPRSLVDEAAAEHLRWAGSPFSVVRPASSFCVAPASFRRRVPEVLLALQRAGLPVNELRLHVLSFLARDALNGLHVCMVLRNVPIRDAYAY